MKPLEGIRILELQSSIAGGFGTQLLAGMGAEVILIEPPGDGIPQRKMPPFIGDNRMSMEDCGPPDPGVPFLKRARGKKSVTLNIESAEGKELLLRLVEQVDALVDSSPPGYMDSFRVSYLQLNTANPRLIYCSVRPFGATGPLKDLPGTDLTLQAISGAMLGGGLVHAMEEEGGPYRCGVEVGQLTASLNLTIGLLAALEMRETTGKGQSVDVSMQDSLAAMKALLLPDNPDGMAIRAPFGVFRARDGDIVICVSREKQWTDLTKVMGNEELSRDPRFQDVGVRCKNVQVLNGIIQEWLKDKSRDKALEILRESRVPCSCITTISELLKDEQLLHRQMVTDLMTSSGEKVEGAKSYGMPIKFSRTPASFDAPAPALGYHTGEVFGGLLKLSKQEMDNLRSEEII